MEIFYYAQKQRFEFNFAKSKGDKKAENFDAAITTKLKELEFEWIDNDHGFGGLVSGSQNSFGMINEICEFLQTLKSL